MKHVETYYTCDICGGDLPNADNNPTSIQVIFTTEQTEGKNITPYLSLQNIDICSLCRDHILKGNYIFASGAMGNNSYYFKNKR